MNHWHGLITIELVGIDLYETRTVCPSVCYSTRRERTPSTMSYIILIVACAALCAGADVNNNTDLDHQVLKRLVSILNDSKNLDLKDVGRLLKTAQSLGINEELVERLLENTKNETKDRVIRKEMGYNSYADADGSGPKESPDYASSVVLASDLLSLTSAVSNVANEM
ncbi:unnamed protein product [Leptidea sinapis]|uniref:Uncharacterized protein n=1 Tax=Leptidea sinapis TaxID=189913 RepID=A0A5E4Q5E2_9NEOP|nr:unnamed protein product [Leptidea sinapis]